MLRRNRSGNFAQLRVGLTPQDLLAFLLAVLLVLTIVSLSGANTWDETVAEAKKEGKLVVVLGGAASRNYRLVFKFFEDRFGIRTVVSTGGGGKPGIEYVTLAHDPKILKKQLEALKRTRELYRKSRSR